MRLWHKYLIGVLPQKQLLGQWRECCLIAKNIAEKGTPNHLLVNKVMEYPIEHFLIYCDSVYEEMCFRGYKCDPNKIMQYADALKFDLSKRYEISYLDIFEGWHNDRYLMQCFYNLQEKYDYGGIDKKEWETLEGRYVDLVCSTWEESYIRNEENDL